MEEGKTVESMADEIQLPEVAIQHIQSFLDRRQAARTIVLSKSWHSAWSTRPILTFDERDFETVLARSQIAEPFSVFVKRRFSKFVMRTLQRYHELNLSIENFRLRIKVTDSDSASLADEFINRAMQLRVNDFSLEIIGGYSKYVLPVQVFEAKSLNNLSVTGCKIDQQFDGGMICSGLESLTLCRVSIGDDMVTDIMLGCPSLQDLHLVKCNGLLNVNASKLHKLEKFSVTKCRDCKLTFLWVDVPEYCKLSCLILEQVKIDDFFFHDFSFKFPCLEDLSLRHCDGFNNIEISSGSLKYISLMHKYDLKTAKFEVPNICKFKFSAFSIPSLSFMTPSREFESYISFTLACWSCVMGDCWYLDLKKFLTELSRSRTSLSITMHLDKWEYRVGNNRGYPIPVVENLMIKIHLSTRLWYAVFDDMFWSCRPKFITFCDDGYFFKTRKLLFNFLVQQESQDCSGSTQKLSYTNDLEEVNVEFFEETLKEWKPLPWQVFLNSSKVKKREEQFRFGLKWRACKRTGAHSSLRT